MPEEIRRAIHFDERRKILTVRSEEDKPAMNGETNVGSLKFTSYAEYNEDGIRMILRNSQKTKDDAEKTLPMLKDRLKELEEEDKQAGKIELTPELLELKGKLEKLKSFYDSEPREKELKNMYDMIKNTEDNLKKATKDLHEIRQEIGTRMQL